jgi:hypothetical protein
MKTAKNIYNRRAVYTGRRRFSNGKVVHRFELLPSRSEMNFGGVVGVWIGYTYECGADSIAKRPKRVDVEREDNAEWEAADELVSDENARKTAEKKIASLSTPALKAARAALAPLVKGLHYHERRELARRLVEDVADQRRKRAGKIDLDAIVSRLRKGEPAKPGKK